METRRLRLAVGRVTDLGEDLPLPLRSFTVKVKFYPARNVEKISIGGNMVIFLLRQRFHPRDGKYEVAFEAISVIIAGDMIIGRSVIIEAME